MNDSVLIVTDQLPYPPRNGITLPIFNYAQGLGRSKQVRICLLVDVAKAVAPSALAENEAKFGSIQIISIKRQPRFARLLSEILGCEMYQHGWLANDLLDLSGLSKPSAILVSPMSAVAKWRSSGGFKHFRNVRHLAGINDCTTAEYFFRYKTQVGDWKFRLKGVVDKLRSPLIGAIEKKLLAPYQTVFLQTTVDRGLMSRLVDQEIANRVVLAPNGVSESFLAVRPVNGKNLVFNAELSGEYAGIARWLIKDVWPLTANVDKTATLLIVGKGASEDLRHLIRDSERVRHLEFVPDLADVYAEAMLAISPVFKGFGLINKTLEAMACGLPVVGGLAAYNGIEGFVADTHGVVCHERSTEVFARALRSLLVDKERRERIGSAARVLVAAQFKWHLTVNKINQSIDRENPSYV